MRDDGYIEPLRIRYPSDPGFDMPDPDGFNPLDKTPKDSFAIPNQNTYGPNSFDEGFVTGNMGSSATPPQHMDRPLPKGDYLGPWLTEATSKGGASKFEMLGTKPLTHVDPDISE